MPIPPSPGSKAKKPFGVAISAMDSPGLLTQDAPTRTRSPRNPLLVILGLGLLIRLVLLYTTSATGLMIVDEQHYHTLAQNLLLGHGFAWEPDIPTSIRPPLYPFLVALVWKVAGSEHLQVMRGVQICLSLINVFILYCLGERLFDRRVALVASAGLCFYPSLIAFNFLLLTEVLFTLFLTLVALGYIVLLKTERSSIAWATGCALGLASLTRSILWPFPLVLCPLAFFSMGGSHWRRVHLVAGLFLGYALVVTPWAVRNTKLQGVLTIVDTMGGLNLRMGNYAHTPLNRAWDAITLTGEQSWAYELRLEHPQASTWTEGRKEKWAQRKALTYMLEHPWLTIQRTLVKFANFWGLERTIIAGWQQGLYHPPQWFAALGTLVITLAYTLMMLLACLGLSLAPPANRGAHLFLILVVMFISGIHTVVFGHERYHLPLVPLLLLYAAVGVGAHSWQRLREGMRTATPPLLACIGLLAIWGYEVFITDVQQIKRLLQALLS